MIRRATKSDAALIRELWEEFESELGGPDYLLETWEEAWTDLSETIATGVALLAEDGGGRSASSSASSVTVAARRRT